MKTIPVWRPYSLVAIGEVFVPVLPQRPGLAVVPLLGAVGTDVSVVLVADAGLAQVLGVVASGVVLGVFDPRHAAVAKEVPDR